MSDKEEKFAKYLQEFEKTEQRYKDGISSAEQKAYEYGVLVVKNCLLIAGGGLLSIPAIVGLSSKFPVDLESSVVAAVCFSGALIASIFPAYIIHLNWLLNASAQEHWLKKRLDFLEAYYLKGAGSEAIETFGYTHPYARKIAILFWIPHALVPLYLVLVIYAFYSLYAAFGVF